MYVSILVSATHTSTVLVRALPPDTTLGVKPVGLIACVLEQKSDNTMGRNIGSRKVAHRRSVVRVRPEILLNITN